MAYYPKSGSLLQPRINASLSTQIVVKVDGVTTVGAIQQLQINQTREMLTWEEIGTHGVIEIHPKNAAKIELTVQRLVFDKMRITEAFARGFVNINAQRIPFNIEIMDTSNGNGYNEIITHYYHNCWFKSFNTVYNSNSYLITDTSNITCEYVTTYIDGLSSVNGGLRGITYIGDSIERNTDTYGERGSFNSAGFSSGISI